LVRKRKTKWVKHIDSGEENGYNDDNVQYNISVSKQEYAKLSSELTRKNGNKPRKIEYAYTDGNFYIVTNNAHGNFDIAIQLEIETNGDLISELSGGIDNGTFKSARSIDSVLEATGLRKGSNNRYSLNSQRTETDGRDADVHRQQSTSDTRGDTTESGGDTQRGQNARSDNSGLTNNSNVRYALDMTLKQRLSSAATAFSYGDIP
jgi:hypothetical protein